ncbi:MAG: hypothetical protein ACYDAO_02420 [Thermoplasmataceae archaeon]
MNNSEVLSSIVTQSTILDIDHNKYIDLANEENSHKPVAMILTRTMELCREGKIDPWDVDLAAFSKVIYGLVIEEQINLPDAGLLISAAWKVLSIKSENVMGKFKERQDSESEIFSENYEEYDDPQEYIGTSFELHAKSHVTLLPAPVYHSEKRKVMLMELMEVIGTLDISIKAKRKDNSTILPISMEDIASRLNVEEPEEEIKKIWNIIMGTEKNEFYMDEIWGSSSDERAMFFVYCMFLARYGKIILSQDKPYGMIMIKRIEDA